MKHKAPHSSTDTANIFNSIQCLALFPPVQACFQRITSPAEGYCDDSVSVYRRHRPEKTCLYQVVERYWPEFWLLLEA
jgi:hypothetical protein